MYQYRPDEPELYTCYRKARGWLPTIPVAPHWPSLPPGNGAGHATTGAAGCVAAGVGCAALFCASRGGSDLRAAAMSGSISDETKACLDNGEEGQ